MHGRNVLILYPAIDILEGKAVRLLKGEYDQQTRYFDDPADAARQWADGGAEYIHVVDLDGAKTGVPVNIDRIESIATQHRVGRIGSAFAGVVLWDDRDL